MDLFSLDIQLIISKKEIYGSRNILEYRKGGEKLEKTKQRATEITPPEKEEIDWAKYLDYTRFFEPAEINNISQELFKKDFEENE